MTDSGPFRADIVGSFLRPQIVTDARQQHALGQLDDTALTELEDAAIERLVQRQADVGLRVASDGELRRSWWHLDFWEHLDGLEIVDLDHGRQFHGVQTRPRDVRVANKIAFPASHPFVDSFRHLDRAAQAAGVTPKITLPAPTVLDFRLDDSRVDAATYHDREDLTEDLVQAYRDALQALYNVGARYIQLDDTAWGYLCSDTEIAKAKARGLHTDGIATRYASMINAVLDGRPDDLVVTTHVCRGNFRSAWVASGGYEPVADALLGGTGYDGFFLEYDTDRAGSFEPLRFLPDGPQRVVLGLITSKHGELESPDTIKRRIEEATAYVPLDQLALSPQCGFASTEEGNLLSEAQQWEKIRAVVSIAHDVWD